MCGIVGYTGPKDCVSILIDGLKKLEYRGYDSAGIAVLDDVTGRIEVRRCQGKISKLSELLKKNPVSAKVGIGHTRWATHGRPSEENAHPHKAGKVAVVHNGIIENYLSLKANLEAEGRKFLSQTDTEVAAHLVSHYLERGYDYVDAVLESLKDIEGAFAFVFINEDYPDLLVAARKESPLLFGLGENGGEYFVASDVPAILNHTRQVIFLDDGEMVVVGSSGYEITDFSGKRVAKPVSHIDWSPVMAEKSGYKHFMLKEIFEQPRVVVDTFGTRIEAETGRVNLSETGISEDLLRSVDRIVIVACGTSYHAALVGKFMIEELARVPVEVDLASEFKYRDPIINDKTLLILISQSGETADTLAALKEGKEKGAHCFSIVNVVGSSLARQSDGVLYTHAGPEISVASTKAFTTQLTALYLFAVHLSTVLGKISQDKAKELVDDLIHLRARLEEALKQDDIIRQIAKDFMHANDFLYLGRGINYPIALEGALKLKEISYIHAEGYPAGEMKHGPIALIDENIPVVVLITRNETYDKIMNNIEEVKARSGKVIAIAEKPDSDLLEKVDGVIEIPSTNKFLMPIVSAIPMQLIAYHIAVLRGTDVDQPRNLAKSVTVE